jgi:cell division protein FtsL
MSVSRIKVGLPLDSPRNLSHASWKWGAKTRAKKEPVSRPRLVKSAPAPPKAASPPENQAVPDLAAAPLSFLSARHFFVLSAVFMAAIILVWGLVRSNHLSVALSYEISDLTQRKLDLLEVNRQLKTELAQIGSLGQLEEAARSVLGLITPSQGQIVVID